jgi:hypothetical protein
VATRVDPDLVEDGIIRSPKASPDASAASQ